MVNNHITDLNHAEARILVLCSLIPTSESYPMRIAAKLSMDYPYCLRMLARLEAKGHIKIDRTYRKSYIIGVSSSGVERAKLVIQHRNKVEPQKTIPEVKP